MGRFKYLAGITTYNPNLNRLKLNINSISRQMEMVMVVDNGSSNISNISNLVSEYDNVLLISNEKNMGIAYAMNVIGNYAVEHAYDWFLTLDQDSICPDNLIDTYVKYIDASIGIISPYIEFNQPFISKLLRLKEESSDSLNSRISDVGYSISSGQFIQTSAWQKIGGFWEYLFIDYVDQEICLNLTRNGYRIVRINDCTLAHEPGIPVKVFGIETAKQSAMREYYVARNSRLVYWNYPDEYKRAIKNRPFISTIKRIANSILVGEDVFAKLKAICCGVHDAFVWKSKHKHNKSRSPFGLKERRY